MLSNLFCPPALSDGFLSPVHLSSISFSSFTSTDFPGDLKDDLRSREAQSDVQFPPIQSRWLKHRRNPFSSSNRMVCNHIHVHGAFALPQRNIPSRSRIDFLCWLAQWWVEQRSSWLWQRLWLWLFSAGTFKLAHHHTHSHIEHIACSYTPFVCFHTAVRGGRVRTATDSRGTSVTEVSPCHQYWSS